jgi:hypothetical protein
MHKPATRRQSSVSMSEGPLLKTSLVAPRTPMICVLAGSRNPPTR